ncbi:hypothetical protein OS493_033828 [Desmophyllum pertusum]|uniref:Uncharacterized protein n=1 Tax=Desmophyllum pertusum TaxID=174260 RepID=A0A9W9YVI7_9CNID|nr:hypothetical protein OS493_033828 [Desmophyllum pertusum]
MFYDVYLCAHRARKLPFIVLTGSAGIQLVAREQVLVSLRRIARVILAAFVARALTPTCACKLRYKLSFVSKAYIFHFQRCFVERKIDRLSSYLRLSFSPIVTAR